MNRSLRHIRVAAEDTLIKGDVFKVMVRRDWRLLHAIAKYAQKDVNIDIARTDPSRFRLLREGVTMFHLKGLSHMTPERVCRLTGYKPDAPDISDGAPSP